MLDYRKLACPQPVIRTKYALEAQAQESIEVLVDNAAASKNVGRFLAGQGYSIQIVVQGADYMVSGQRQPGQPVQSLPPEVFTCATDGEQRILVFVRSNTLGQGDDALGAGLMKNFLLTLKDMGPELWRLVLVNAGVKLSCEGAETLLALKDLEAAGAGILVCGTCLNHFGLLEKKQTGETTNMLDIVTSMQAASKVITI
jgi:selenium metabolism protein YedF